MSSIEDMDLTLSQEVAKIATADRLKMKEQQKTYRIAIVMLSLVVIVAMICGSVIAIRTITEQQYALNAQYAQMHDLLSGAIVYDTGDDGVIIRDSDNNSVATGGANINGEDD